MGISRLLSALTLPGARLLSPFDIARDVRKYIRQVSATGISSGAWVKRKQACSLGSQQQHGLIGYKGESGPVVTKAAVKRQPHSIARGHVR